MSDIKDAEVVTELSKEDLQIIVQALSLTQVQVKDAPRIMEIVNKCHALINTQ